MKARTRWLVGSLVVLIVLTIMFAPWSRSTSSERSAVTAPKTPTAVPAAIPAGAAPPFAAPPAPAPVPSPSIPSPTGRVGFREADADDELYTTERTRQVRREIWQGLEDFSNEAKLTEEQWHRFLSTLQESAIQFGYVLNENGNRRMDPEEFQPTSDELGRELEERLADFLDEKQLRLFKFRFHSNLLPAQLARGNILQSADQPDQRAWTPSADGVWPTDRL